MDPESSREITRPFNRLAAKLALVASDVALIVAVGDEAVAMSNFFESNQHATGRMIGGIYLAGFSLFARYYSHCIEPEEN